MKDPIQVHLLTETALSDSKDFEILSQEEVDDLKKQVQLLTQRVEQAKSNLAIQSKYRDAAISMAKLYSPNNGGNGALMTDGDGSGLEAEMERRASERRCEELAAELLNLEKRLLVPQRRLLQHTAGILQVTHRASSRKPNQPPRSQPLPNGIPGSPESLYTYTNGRNSIETPEDDVSFDDRSLYLSLDQMDTQSALPLPLKNTIEIPLKSPVREQQNQLREETDRLRDENVRLNAEVERLRTGDELVAETERRLGAVTDQLRDMTVRSGLAVVDSFPEPPSASEVDRAAAPGALVRSRVDYLERGLAVALEQLVIQASQGQVAAASLSEVEGKIVTINRQIYDVLQNMRLSYPSPPPPPPPAAETTSGFQQQFDYLLGSFSTVQSELSSSTAADKKNNDQVDTVLVGLWETIQSGYAKLQQQKEERRKARSDMGLKEDEDDMSGDETAIDTSEPYSLQAFSTKIRWLYAQATSLKEQKVVLKRQIKQQRELNNKSSSQKDVELQQRLDELQRTRELLNSTEKQAQEAQGKLDVALNDLVALQQANTANESAAVMAAQDQLRERDAEIAHLNASAKDLQSNVLAVESAISVAKTQLSEATEAKKAAEAAAEKIEREVKDKDEELDRMNQMVIELKTDLAFTKADLEGAYGSRAQRAAEAAALNKNSENAELTARIEILEKELADNIKQLEETTKVAVSSEKEALELEGKLDDAIAAKDRLESEVTVIREKLNSEVSRLKEQLDAERLKAPPSPNTANLQPRAGATMLSEQFRATMKEERKKFQEELKVCLFSPPTCAIHTS